MSEVSKAAAAPAAPRPRWRRPWLRFLVVGLAVASLAGVERGARYASAILTLPTGTARWIWAPGDWWNKAEPVAFDIACDFELAALPERAVLAAQADEEYLLWLNGRPVGVGRFVETTPLDAYDVEALLQPGGNRLVARVRSARGDGGFLASIQADGRQVLASGKSCRVLSPAPEGIVEGWLPLPDDGEPVVWGWPPTGRWGTPALGNLRPAGWTEPSAGEPIRAMTRRVLSLPPGAEAGGEITLFEWAHPVTGLLRLRLSGQDASAALLFLDDQAPSPRLHRSGRVIVTADWDREWTDVQSRSFRFALVAGLKGVKSAAVLAAAGAAPLPAVRGVFGVRPPPLRLPVEDEIRRRFAGFEGLVLDGSPAFPTADAER